MSNLFLHAITAYSAASVLIFLLYYGLAALVAKKDPNALRYLAPMHPRAALRYWMKRQRRRRD
jgi:hypothetical protein